MFGPRNIGRFLDHLARPQVVREDLAEGYRATAADERHEAEATQWNQSLWGTSQMGNIERVQSRRGKLWPLVFDPASGPGITKRAPQSWSATISPTAFLEAARRGNKHGFEYSHQIREE
jgi:hypothetical protein